MFRKAFSFGGLLLLAGATVLVTPGLGQAQGGRYYAGYGYYPYSGGNTYYNPYAYGRPYSTDDWEHYPTYDQTPSTNRPEIYLWVGTNTRGSYEDQTPSYSYGSLSSGGSSYYDSATDNRAHITVQVPAGVRLTFDGTPTTSTGPVREFTSPPLRPGIRYTYLIRAHWGDGNGGENIQSREVKVRPGAHIDVSFSGPSGAAGQAR